MPHLVIDTTTRMSNIPTAWFFDNPAIIQKGWDQWTAPAYSFLIEHHATGTQVLFDLGVRKDFENHPVAAKMKKAGVGKVEVQKGVREILEENGVHGSRIKAVIWSHWHFDHVGDMSTFDPDTRLVVGPGFKDAFLPGYPADPEGQILESDYAGRELVEISFDGQGDVDGPVTTIGRFAAFDYFGDGSFYLLDSPGHAIGHLCGLARVSSGKDDGNGGGDTYVLMGGDAVHHCGELRPSPWRTLPKKSNGSEDVAAPASADTAAGCGSVCPGGLFEKLYRDGDDQKPFLGLATVAGSVTADAKMAEQTVEKLQEADAHDKVFVIHAHDSDLLNIIDFFPKSVSDFENKDWAEKGRWAFLKDFEQVLNH
ncbi:beta-lactamase-like protein [Coniella lustricola]|uniref:Beta-lactamase-like protein n=1 Tax=Coniella lustricola TaxID=2025994 RepID=A0A2T2ZT83_9PEZI|nr:beta-lactamase-like protein [Coniella lustricola]